RQCHRCADRPPPPEARWAIRAKTFAHRARCRLRAARRRRTIMRLRPRHLRTRLTLWYVSVLAALLILAWGGTCALLFRQLRSQLDHFAIQEIETVEGLFFFTPSGQLRLREDYHNHPESKDV